MKEAKHLNFAAKLLGFERRNSLNERAETKTVHVSLNFDPAENIPNKKMLEIAITYMQKIGFEKQPFLVYRHNDAGHPHIHIVSTTIKENGKRIDTHNIGRNQSEKARKEIENTFGLIKAEGRQNSLGAEIIPLKLQPADYGKAATKRAISNIVNKVFQQYRFSSLPEFNAALRQFNVIADRGREEGRVFKHRGLLFSMLDGSGKKVGVPIKASSISCKPTLDNLEKIYERNEALKAPLKTRLQNVIDACLNQNFGDIEVLASVLSHFHVYASLRRSPDGKLYGVTFVDNENKAVFKGSDLGKGFSAAALEKRMTQIPAPEIIKVDNEKPVGSGSFSQGKQIHKQQQKLLPNIPKQHSMIDILFTANDHFEPTNNLLPKKKKRKKRKSNS
ncbi:relaxase/mobilization nuclease domain-containing protein [Ferruginibacter sp.]